MPRAGIEPATRGFSVLCSTDWAIWAHGSGNRIWTYDLRVMSPTSYLAAPSRVIGNMVGEGFEPSKLSQQIYSLPPLAARESHQKADDRTRTDNLLITNQLLCQLSHVGILFALNIICLTYISIGRPFDAIASAHKLSHARLCTIVIAHFSI